MGPFLCVLLRNSFSISTGPKYSRRKKESGFKKPKLNSNQYKIFSYWAKKTLGTEAMSFGFLCLDNRTKKPVSFPA